MNGTISPIASDPDFGGGFLAAMARAISAFLEAEERTEVAGVARCGNEAVQMARLLKPELVLLDLFLPGLSGLEVVRGVRRRSPSTRIIIVTVLGEEMVSACKGFGAEGFVTRSRLEEQLPSEIERVFGTSA